MVFSPKEIPPGLRRSMNAVLANERGGFPSYGESHRGTWYLIREDVDLDGRLLKAGTPILKVPDGWVVEGSTVVTAQPLEKHACRTQYGGLSLYLINRDSQGAIVHRRVGSKGEPKRIPSTKVFSPPDFGHSKVYLAFGGKFYPLEYFGW